MAKPKPEEHLVNRIGWLRAAVLGANDGILSTASLISGVAASNATSQSILIAGVAGLVAGAMSMAAGEYVSVSSQSDTEAADIERERRELEDMPAAELQELVDIYVKRGVDPGLARQVAEQMTAKDALGAHTRDELGITEQMVAQPVVAAFTSAATFSAGAAVPVVAAIVSPEPHVIWVVTITSLIALGVLGAIGAQVGGAGIARPTLRVLFWGALAMALTAAVGHLTGTRL